MCTTCGCSDNRTTKITRIAHEHTHGHAAPHPHRPDEHTHEHHHESDGHQHADPHEHPHAPEGVRKLDVRPSTRTLQLEIDVLAKNDRLAERNRGWLDGRCVSAWNLMSSPGAGKTTLLTRTIRELGSELRLGVIEGDQATLRDAERIREAGGHVVQINTGSGCHLDAAMIAVALDQLAPPMHSIVLIENVGNLVCPALFDLGERKRAVLLSVTEGEDKALKYPHMFRAAEILILTKIDLLPHLDFDVDQCLAHAHRINPRLEILRVSATRGDGLAAWYELLRQSLPAQASSL